MEKVKKELQSERMMRMAENDRVQETERQLYQSETLVAELQSKTMKMALKIEELRIKYEPGECLEYMVLTSTTVLLGECPECVVLTSSTVLLA